MVPEMVNHHPFYSETLTVYYESLLGFCEGLEFVACSIYGFAGAGCFM